MHTVSDILAMIRHFTGLCKSVHPWGRVSEIQPIKGTDYTDTKAAHDIQLLRIAWGPVHMHLPGHWYGISNYGVDGTTLRQEAKWNCNALSPENGNGDAHLALHPSACQSRKRSISLCGQWSKLLVASATLYAV